MHVSDDLGGHEVPDVTVVIPNAAPHVGRDVLVQDGDYVADVKLQKVGSA